ncbi:hypothetical protein [Nonomuraea sp. NPDC052265]|uniref:hypothetical protein n=1 Tax=Nonomuraea sp. NPDC052265 TaxID=3364374 RepID=UPI0037C73E32
MRKSHIGIQAAPSRPIARLAVPRPEVPPDGRWHERPPVGPLDDQEQRDPDDPPESGVPVSGDGGIDDQRNAGRDRNGSHEADAAAPAADGREQADRDLDDEHPGPAQVLGDDAAQEHTGGAEEQPAVSRITSAVLPAGAAAPYRAMALLGSRGLYPKSIMGRVIAAGAMSAPRTPCTARPALSPRGRAGRGDDQGPADQHRPSGDEHSARPEQVGRPPAQQRQPAEGRDVGVAHPLQPADPATRITDVSVITMNWTAVSTITVCCRS